MASETKALILRRFEEARRDVLEAIRGLSESQMRQATLGDWCVADVLSHMALWHELRYFDIRRLATGYESAYEMTAEQEEAFNLMSVCWRRHLSTAQVLWEITTSAAHVVEAIEACNAQLELVLATDWPLETRHDAGHAAQIREWRQKHGI